MLPRHVVMLSSIVCWFSNCGGTLKSDGPSRDAATGFRADTGSIAARDAGSPAKRDAGLLAERDAGRTDSGAVAALDGAHASIDAGTVATRDAGADAGTTSQRDATSSAGTGSVIGNDGIAGWNSLSSASRSDVQRARSFFLHQSVGGDLEDGSQAAGYPFEWVASGSTSLSAGLNGGLFNSSNGDPSGKIAEFRSMALANRATLAVAIMKFGYADVLDDTVASAQSAYESAVHAIKAQGVAVLHVTPPLVYNAPSDNAPKMAMREWMLRTFSDDVIFDLQDIESTNPSTGARCSRGGSWEICDAVRSTAGCASLNQGVDAASGQGHLCYAHARRIAPAFLYAIYLASQP